MKEKFKIDKELLFKNNIREITSISLDSDYKIVDNTIVGNFIINGDYKIHEVSINREKFNFKIPFKHDIGKDIDNDTMKLEITDFVYDYKKDVLIVNIEYEIVGDRKDIFIFENEETLDDFLNKREVEVIDTRIDEIKQSLDEEEEIDTNNNCLNNKDVIITPYNKGDIIDNNRENKDLSIENKEDVDKKEERLFDNIKNSLEFFKDNEVKEYNIDKMDVLDKDNSDNKIYNIDDNINQENVSMEKEIENVDININKEDNVKTEEIINNISNIEDRFITYKVYKVKESDTLDGIVLKYHTSLDELKEYNELSNISVGDKIIIPINE